MLPSCCALLHERELQSLINNNPKNPRHNLLFDTKKKSITESTKKIQSLSTHNTTARRRTGAEAGTSFARTSTLFRALADSNISKKTANDIWQGLKTSRRFNGPPRTEIKMLRRYGSVRAGTTSLS